MGEGGELKLECNNLPIKPGEKYYFTVPAKDGSIYLFDEKAGEHHSNFKWNEERNPDFSVVAAGSFIVDENVKIAAIINDSGHFKPSSKDCTESFLRVLSKNMYSSLVEGGLEIADRSIKELLSESRKINDENYNISIDITKCGGVVIDRDKVTIESAELDNAITDISERRLNLIDENAKRHCRKRQI